jgi:chromosomal replication initiator protein
MGRDITVDFTKDVLKDFIKTDDRETTPEEIQKTVSKYYNIKLSELKGKKKSSSIVLPRQVAMYLTRQLTTLSLPEVGQQFSGKDHSTVIYSVKKIEGLIKKDEKIKNDIDQLLKKL